MLKFSYLLKVYELRAQINKQPVIVVALSAEISILLHQRNRGYVPLLTAEQSGWIDFSNN
jgi:hypothetical protein